MQFAAASVPEAPALGDPHLNSVPLGQRRHNRIFAEIICSRTEG